MGNTPLSQQCLQAANHIYNYLDRRSSYPQQGYYETPGYYHDNDYPNHDNSRDSDNGSFTSNHQWNSPRPWNVPWPWNGPQCRNSPNHHSDWNRTPPVISPQKRKRPYPESPEDFNYPIRRKRPYTDYNDVDYNGNQPDSTVWNSERESFMGSPNTHDSPWQVPACVPKLLDVVADLPFQLTPPDPQALDFGLPPSPSRHLSKSPIPPQKTEKLTKEDLDILHGKAVKFMTIRKQNAFKVCKGFYRNKSKSYYDEIMDMHDGVMKPYTKDFNGDPASSINGAIKGLFFAATMNFRGNVPVQSPFGDWRLIVPPNWMMDPEETNLYFADFYCMVNKSPHYVTLVLTQKWSWTDHFCALKLKKLNMFDNPFLKIRHGDGSILVTANVLVEVLYTENVPVREWLASPYCTLRRTEGPAVSPCGSGLPKDPNCDKCNLEHGETNKDAKKRVSL